MSIYPENIGIKLTKKTFSKVQIEALKNKLPKNLILRVYGLAGVGKGTLSKMLAQTLEIPNMESSLILRCATFIYENKNLPLNKENTDQVFEDMDIYVENQELKFGLNGAKIEKKDLKTANIDKKVTKYSSDLYVREKFDKALDNLVQRVFDSAVVADGRGAFEPYLLNAQQYGFQVIRILVDADQKVKAKRYYQEYVKNQILANPDFIETDNLKDKVLKEFEQAILERDKKDVANIEDKKIGLISQDSGILDTSHLTPGEVLETALSFVENQLKA